MRTLVLLCCTLGGAYAGALATTSLASEELLLSPGETRRFCGAYLDCHLGVAVVESRVLGPEPAAPGMRRVAVQVRLSSDARRARLALDRPSTTIRDAEGRRWFRDLDAERQLGLDPASAEARSSSRRPPFGLSPVWQPAHFASRIGWTCL